MIFNTQNISLDLILTPVCLCLCREFLRDAHGVKFRFSHVLHSCTVQLVETSRRKRRYFHDPVDIIILRFAYRATAKRLMLNMEEKWISQTTSLFVFAMSPDSCIVTSFITILIMCLFFVLFLSY